MIKKIYLALGESESWVDSSTLGLFPTMWDFPDPKVKRYAVSVPGLSGDIDLSDVLTGDVSFENVNGVISFRVLDASKFDFSAFRQKYHGKTVKFRKDTDPNYYRIGRVEIMDDDRQDVLRGFSLSVDADPFAYSMTESSHTLQVGVAADESKNGTYNYVAPSVPSDLVVSLPTAGVYPSNTDIKLYPDSGTWGSSTSTPNFEIRVTKNALQKKTAVFQDGVEIDVKFLDYLTSDNTLAKNSVYMLDGIVQVYNGGITGIYGYVKGYAYIEANGKRYGLNETFSIGTSGNAYLHLVCYVKSNYLYANEASVILSGMKLKKLGSTQNVANNGRKTVVPTVTSSVDANIITQYGVEKLVAGKPSRMFGLTLKPGQIDTAIYQDSGTVGTATIKYREGHLR